MTGKLAKMWLVGLAVLSILAITCFAWRQWLIPAPDFNTEMRPILNKNCIA